MPELHGFMQPRSPEGRASLVPNPPWHYSGQMLTIEYRTDPSRVAALLPDPLEPADEDPGAVALIWADWQSCSASFEELLDPVRSQYMEFFVVIRCQYRGETFSRSPYIWVDRDYALARGWHQGYPKKLAEIFMTRPVTVGRAGPRLERGAVFGATLAAYGRRLANAKFTVTGESDANRFVPSIERDAKPSLNELVTMRGYDSEVSPTWAGTAEIELFPSPTEELAALEPREMIGAYY